jgi:hypothetical protein
MRLAMKKDAKWAKMTALNVGFAEGGGNTSRYLLTTPAAETRPLSKSTGVSIRSWLNAGVVNRVA